MQRRALRWCAVLSVALAGCHEADGKATIDGRYRSESLEAAAPNQGSTLILAIDRSGSRPQADVEADRELIRKLIIGLNPGDTAIIMDVCAAVRDHRCRPWEASMPVPDADTRQTERAVEELQDARGDVLFHLRTMLADTNRPATTNLLATLRTVDDLAAGRQGPVRLVLFSDMIQAAEGVYLGRIESVPDPEAMSLPPKLNGVCVSAVGVTDPGTPLGRAVAEFWHTYLLRSGARFDLARYRYVVTSPAALECADAN